MAHTEGSSPRRSRTAPQGAAGQGMSWLGPARQGKGLEGEWHTSVVRVPDTRAWLDRAWRGSARQCMAGPCLVRRDRARHGGGWMVAPEFDSPAPTRGRAAARLGSAVLGVAWHREARKQGGRMACIEVRALDAHAWFGGARHGVAWLGEAAQGMEHNKEIGWAAHSRVQVLGTHARRGSAGLVPARLGMARRVSASAGPGGSPQGEEQGRANGIHSGSRPERPRKARRCLAWQRCGMAVLGAACSGAAWQGKGLRRADGIPQRSSR